MIARNRWMLLGAAALLVGAASTDLAAQGKSREHEQGQGQGGGKKEKKDKKDNKNEREDYSQKIFRESDRATFQNYFVTHRIYAQSLPPGIAKKLARGKPLPPGIAKRYLPDDLRRIGPVVGNDVSFDIVGTSVVATRAGIIIDILNGILRK